jgi:hypothetical protein
MSVLVGEIGYGTCGGDNAEKSDATESLEEPPVLSDWLVFLRDSEQDISSGAQRAPELTGVGVAPGIVEGVVASALNTIGAFRVC